MKVVVLTFKSLCNWRMLFSPAEPHWEEKKNKKKATTQKKQVQLCFCRLEKQSDRVGLALDLVYCSCVVRGGRQDGGRGK